MKKLIFLILLMQVQFNLCAQNLDETHFYPYDRKIDNVKTIEHKYDIAFAPWSIFNNNRFDYLDYYEYDKKGRLIFEKTIASDGSEGRKIFKYGTNERLVLKETFMNSKKTCEAIYRHNAFNKTTFHEEICDYEYSGDSFVKEESVYNDKGDLLEREYRSSSDYSKYYRKSNYTYDAEGRKISRAYLNSENDSPLKESLEKYYYTNDNITSIISKTPKGELVWEGSYQYQNDKIFKSKITGYDDNEVVYYEFNRNGDEIHSKTEDLKGKLKFESKKDPLTSNLVYEYWDGVETKYSYNAKGDLTEQTSYQNGIVSIHSSFEYRYDSRGNWIYLKETRDEGSETLHRAERRVITYY